MQITTKASARHQITVTAAPWAMVRAALTPVDGPLVPGYADAGQFWYDHIQTACVEAGWDLDFSYPPEHHVVLVARQPSGGDVREWRIADDILPGHVPFVPEAGGAGWDVVGCSTADHLYYRSGSSGSAIRADRDAGGWWTLTLDVPVRDGQPYRGGFWMSFHRALDMVECVRCGAGIHPKDGDMCGGCVAAVATAG